MKFGKNSETVFDSVDMKLSGRNNRSPPTWEVFIAQKITP